MKVRIDKQKIMEVLVDVVVIAAIATFLWNLILPAITKLPSVSYWMSFSIVLGVYILRYLYKPKSVYEAEEIEATSDSSLI